MKDKLGMNRGSFKINVNYLFLKVSQVINLSLCTLNEFIILPFNLCSFTIKITFCLLIGKWLIYKKSVSKNLFNFLSLLLREMNQFKIGNRFERFSLLLLLLFMIQGNDQHLFSLILNVPFAVNHLRTNYSLKFPVY